MKQRSLTPPVTQTKCQHGSQHPYTPSAPSSGAFKYTVDDDSLASEFGEFFSASEVQTDVPSLLAGLMVAVDPRDWRDVPPGQQFELVEEWCRRLEVGEPAASVAVSVTAEVVEDCQRQHQAAEALAGVAIGAGHPAFGSYSAYTDALRENAGLLFCAGALPPTLTLFCALLAAHRDFPGALGDIPRTLLGHCSTILYSLCLATPDRTALREALATFEYDGVDLPAFLLHVLKDRVVDPTAAVVPFIPLKKLLLLLWRVLDVVCDVPQRAPTGDHLPQSGLKVFPGDVTRYIQGVCQTPSGVDLAPEYLLLWYYGRFDATVHPAFASFAATDSAEFDRLAIPFPVREALEVLARRHQQQWRDAVRRFGPLPTLRPVDVSIPFCLPTNGPSGDPTGDEDSEDEDEEDEEGSDEEAVEGNHLDEPDGHAPRAFRPAQTPAEALYRALLPILSPVLLCLLRPFLAALPNASAAPLDLATDLTGPTVVPKADPKPDGSDRASQELRRHKEIVLKAIGALLLLVVRVLHRNHPLQAACVAEGVCGANGLLLLLKFLNQRDPIQFVACPTMDVAGFEWEEVAHSPLSLMMDAEAFPESLRGEDGPTGGVTAVVPAEGSQCICVMTRYLHSCISCVQLLHKLTKSNVTRLAVLAGYKVHVMMKRLLRISDPTLARFAAKVLKAVQRATGRKWRASNMKVYSLVYRAVRHDLSDCHLFSETGPDATDPLLLPLPTGFTTDRDAARAIREFNRREYPEGRSREPSTASADELHSRFLHWYAQRYPDHARPWGGAPLTGSTP